MSNKTVNPPDDPEITTCSGERVKEKPARMPEEAPVRVKEPKPIPAPKVFYPAPIEVLS